MITGLARKGQGGGGWKGQGGGGLLIVCAMFMRRGEETCEGLLEWMIHWRGSWVLGVGCWVLGVGCRVLGVGHDRNAGMLLLLWVLVENGEMKG
jgi:hypothetical protein